MAVRIEDIKREGIAVDIDALARTGFESISEADRYRLKTQGVCAQKHVGVFMIRIRVPGGKMWPSQLRRVAELAATHGHGSVHVTTRAGLELHHVRIEHVPAVFAGLGEAGLTTKGACGDTLRNVVACAHAGTFAGEVLPPAPFVEMLHARIVQISDATNLSRKMNVAIGCSPLCDEQVATSDIGFLATPAAGGGPAGFAVWGAGGLGATPRLAIPLFPFLPQRDLLAAFTAIVAMGEKHGDRSNRARAKIKMLVERWGEARVREVFLGELETARSRGLPALEVQAAAEEVYARPRLVPLRSVPGGAQEQKQAGLFTLPALIPMGELSQAAAAALCDAAERFGDGLIHLTPDQNAELQGVPEAKLEAAAAALERAELRTRGRGGIADVVACVGTEYCPIAVSSSMATGRELSQSLGARREDYRYADFRIHVSGCPHSCARHQVADVGLAGGTMKVDGAVVEAFVLYVGGNAHERRLGEPWERKFPRSHAPDVVEALLRTYESLALPGERFSRTVARVGSGPFFAAAAAALDGQGPPQESAHAA